MSGRLQRALLPYVNPQIPQHEIASEYVAGTEGHRDRWRLVQRRQCRRRPVRVRRRRRLRSRRRRRCRDGTRAVHAARLPPRWQHSRRGPREVLPTVRHRGRRPHHHRGRRARDLAHRGDRRRQRRPPAPAARVRPATRYCRCRSVPRSGSARRRTAPRRSRCLPGPPCSPTPTAWSNVAAKTSTPACNGWPTQPWRTRTQPVSQLLTSLLEDLRRDGAADDIALLALRRSTST